MSDDKILIADASTIPFEVWCFAIHVHTPDGYCIKNSLGPNCTFEGGEE